MSDKKYLNYDWSVVVNFETGGKGYYERFLKFASWPGGFSGITLGIGADLGYITTSEFEKYFKKHFTEQEVKALVQVIGKKGEAAKMSLSAVKNVKLDWKNASELFMEWTLPKFWTLANSVWPGIDQLCESAQVALVSIIFNRGSSLKGSTRTEMVKIRDLVKTKNYKEIATQVRSMKRLWEGKKQEGLIKRREEEAKLIESCL